LMSSALDLSPFEPKFDRELLFPMGSSYVWYGDSWWKRQCPRALKPLRLQTDGRTTYFQYTHQVFWGGCGGGGVCVIIMKVKCRINGVPWSASLINKYLLLNLIWLYNHYVSPPFLALRLYDHCPLPLPWSCLIITYLYWPHGGTQALDHRVRRRHRQILHHHLLWFRSDHNSLNVRKTSNQSDFPKNILQTSTCK
jgi:hypothetical protein